MRHEGESLSFLKALMSRQLTPPDAMRAAGRGVVGLLIWRRRTPRVRNFITWGVLLIAATIPGAHYLVEPRWSKVVQWSRYAVIVLAAIGALLLLWYIIWLSMDLHGRRQARKYDDEELLPGPGTARRPEPQAPAASHQAMPVPESPDSGLEETMVFGSPVVGNPDEGEMPQFGPAEGESMDDWINRSGS